MDAADRPVRIGGVALPTRGTGGYLELGCASCRSGRDNSARRCWCQELAGALGGGVIRQSLFGPYQGAPGPRHVGGQLVACVLRAQVSKRAGPGRQPVAFGEQWLRVDRRRSYAPSLCSFERTLTFPSPRSA